MSVTISTRATSTGNGLSPVAVAKPSGLVDGDALVALVTVPTLSTLNSVVTPPTGWVELGHFYAPASGAIGITQAWFAKPIPSAAAETDTSYTFTASNIGAARSLVQMGIAKDRDLTALGTSIPKNSTSRSSSSQATPTGAINPSGTGDLWDIIYSGGARNNTTWTGPDTELDDYLPAANTSAAIYGLFDQPSGSYNKTMTAGTASSAGIGVIIALKKLAAPPLSSPIKRWNGTAYVNQKALRWNGTAYVPVVINT